jgi:hypothetical protein
MKRKLYAMALLMSAFLISCQKEEEPGLKEKGSLDLSITSALQVNEVNSHLKAAPVIEDFKVTIYQSDGTEVMAFDSTALRPDTLELEVGDYYVEAHSDNNLPAAFENPYYYGLSEIFTISANTHSSVQVHCLLANTIVSVVYSDQVIHAFLEYRTTVTSALDSLVYEEDETRWGYFQTLPLEIRVALSYQKPDGTEVSRNLSGSIPFPLANRHYEIFVDAAISEGLAAFQITLDSTEVPIEVVEISGTSEIPVSGAVGYGDLLITEIMYDPAALSDTEGEWFELYNNSDQTINLQNLILGRDDLNRHTITDPVLLLPGAYLVFQRTDTATAASNKYIYGSDLLLPNTGAVLAIYNEGTETDPGALIFSVDYGGAGFPDGSGASVSLNPDLLNAADAVQGTSWCIAASTYDTGDLGTPGAVNDACQ